MLSLLNINSASVMGWLESAATQQWIVGILLLLLFICFIKEWMPVEITALAGTAVLMLTGILSTRDVLSSFGQQRPADGGLHVHPERLPGKDGADRGPLQAFQQGSQRPGS